MNFKTFISTGFAIQITLTLPAATLTVTSLGDNVPGCLRDMVTGSNPGDTIEFGVTGVIVLSGRIPVTKLLYIHGPGPGKLAIDANRAGRAFITGPNPVEISNLTISNGLVVGVNGADAMMPGMNGQNGDHAYGGAILTTGDLLISNCWFHANTVIGGDGGSGGEYIPAASTQPGNGGAGGDAAGAAVYLDTFNSVDITAIKCTFSANIAMGGNGGMGGANNNLSIVKPGGDGGNGGGAADGSGNLSYVTNCTFSGNLVTSGAGGRGGYSINTTGGKGGDGGQAEGGGLFIAKTIGTIICSTIVSNSVIGSPGGAGGTGSPNGSAGATGLGFAGGLDGFSFGCDRHIGNTIIANNYASTSYSNYFASIDDLGFNFLGDDAVQFCSFASSTLVGTVPNPLDPQLGPLTQNGGGVPTHSPLQSSPVINRGYRFGAISDQRGAARPFGQPLVTGSDGSDIGAFEFGSPPIGLGSVGTNVVVSWPAAYGDFNLQSAPGLTGPASWIDVTDAPVVIGDQFIVSNSIVDPVRFYRLIKH